MIAGIEINDEIWFVMNCYLGGPLNQHIVHASGGRLSLEVASIYLAELADALFYLASHRCVHRDIKSSNCVLDHQGKIRLCDFGSAVILSNETEWLFAPNVL